MSASDALDRTRRLIYDSPVHEILNKLGLGDPLATIYWKLQFFISDDTVTRSVGTTNAQFYTTTRQEFTRFHDPTLHGEIDVLESILQSLNPDDVFYDIGANVGLHACFAGNLLDSGTVVAIEPHPKSVDQLEENLTLNNISGIVREYAFASEYGNAVLDISTDQPGAIGSVESTDTLHVDGIEIDLVPGDDVIGPDGLPLPDVMKIDVDGGEFDVLHGLKETLQLGDCRYIFCEIHPHALLDYGATEEDVIDILRDMDYDLRELNISHDVRTDAYFIHAEANN